MRAVQWRFLLTSAVLVVLMLNTQRLLFLPAGNEAQLTCNSTTYKPFVYGSSRIPTFCAIITCIQLCVIFCFQFLVMEMMWTTEIQILNEEMIVAVVIAI